MSYLAVSTHALTLPIGLKKCRITKVWKKIPQSSPFSCFDDIRKHWKNTYGYRLREDESRYYVGVMFWGNCEFTYPIECLRSSPPVYLTHPNPHDLIRSFIIDVNKKIKQICGTKFTMESYVGYSHTALYPANIVSQMNKLNLTTHLLQSTTKKETSDKEEQKLCATLSPLSSMNDSLSVCKSRTNRDVSQLVQWNPNDQHNHTAFMDPNWNPLLRTGYDKEVEFYKRTKWISSNYHSRSETNSRQNYSNISIEDAFDRFDDKNLISNISESFENGEMKRSYDVKPGDDFPQEKPKGGSNGVVATGDVTDVNFNELLELPDKAPNKFEDRVDEHSSSLLSQNMQIFESLDLDIGSSARDNSQTNIACWSEGKKTTNLSRFNLDESCLCGDLVVSGLEGCPNQAANAEIKMGINEPCSRPLPQHIHQPNLCQTSHQIQITSPIVSKVNFEPKIKPVFMKAKLNSASIISGNKVFKPVFKIAKKCSGVLKEHSNVGLPKNDNLNDGKVTDSDERYKDKSVNQPFAPTFSRKTALKSVTLLAKQSSESNLDEDAFLISAHQFNCPIKPIFTSKSTRKPTSNCSVKAVKSTVDTRIDVYAVEISGNIADKENELVLQAARSTASLQVPVFHRPQHKSSANTVKRIGNGSGKRDNNSQKVKRQSSVSSSQEGACKRPRIKCGTDQSVEELAASGKLNQAKAATLMAYLRDNGVPVKGRDKKGQLIDKVLAHLNLPTSTT